MMIHQQMRLHCSEYDCGTLPVAVNIAHFQGASGVDEYHLMAQPTAYADIATQTAWLRSAYQQACMAQGLDADTAVFRRFFCSDLSNQNALVDALSDAGDACALSWVCQPPLPPAKIALWAYHLRLPEGKLVKQQEGAWLSVQRGALSHHWTTGLTCPAGQSSLRQTEGILGRYDGGLHARGMTLANDVLRTWFFVRDVDVHYQGLVTARKEFFAKRGLTAETHYIASTGIEGRSVDIDAGVMMDAYAIAGVRREQIRYLAAPTHLCPTHCYGVTFERGVAVAYQDRTHVMISGTASINAAGQILHAGNVEKQLERTLENIHALLQQAGADFPDVGMCIVYVRDPSDLHLIHDRMRERFAAMPVQVVLAPVCRPGWLVEVECQAIIPTASPQFPAF